MRLLKITVICLPIFFILLLAVLLFKIEKEKKYILGNLGQLEQQLTLRVAQDLEKFDKLNKENFKTQIKAVFQEKIQEEFDEKLQERFDSQLTFETEIKKSFKKQLNQQTKILNNLREDQKKNIMVIITSPISQNWINKNCI